MGSSSRPDDPFGDPFREPRRGCLVPTLITLTWAVALVVALMIGGSAGFCDDNSSSAGSCKQDAAAGVVIALIGAVTLTIVIVRMSRQQR